MLDVFINNIKSVFMRVNNKDKKDENFGKHYQELLDKIEGIEK